MRRLGLIAAVVLAGAAAVVMVLRLRPAEKFPTDPVMPPVMPPPPAPPKPAPRTMPRYFSAGMAMPRGHEQDASGPVGSNDFSAAMDIVDVRDARVKWESDERPGGPENDHLMHRDAEAPFRKCISMACSNGAVVRVHDSYRPAGAHRSNSLHKEGRALDLSCEGMSHEQLAKFAWMAGFDWVYYEKGSGSGHIHCSVRASPRTNNVERAPAVQPPPKGK